jgi:phage shock protein PspC (stress-responsive transcriptional regulator)
MTEEPRPPTPDPRAEDAPAFPPGASLPPAAAFPAGEPRLGEELPVVAGTGEADAPTVVGGGAPEGPTGAAGSHDLPTDVLDGPTVVAGAGPGGGAAGGEASPEPPTGSGPPGPPPGGEAYGSSVPPGPPGGSGPPGPPPGSGPSWSPGGGGSTAAPGPYWGGQSGRRLRRSTSRKVLGGVAGGLGEFTGIDPVLFRVLFAVLTLFGGTGLLLYLLAWLFVPADDQPASPAETLIARGTGSAKGRDAGVAAALVLAGVFLAGVLVRGDADDVVLLLVVLGLGYFLLRALPERRGEVPPGPPPPAPLPYEQPAYPTGGTATLTAPVAPPVTAPAAAPERERSVLGAVTVSLLLVALGLTAGLDAGGAIDPAPEDYLAVAVTVLGVGLLVGAFVGRARWLALLGLPPLVALVVLGSTGVSLRGGIGERIYTPERAVDIQDSYRLGVGELRLDLSDVDLSGRLTEVRLSAGVGHIEVIVPDGADVSVRGRANMGEALLFDKRQNGTSVDLSTVEPALEGDGKLDLVLDVQVDVGQVEVHRATA